VLVVFRGAGPRLRAALIGCRQPADDPVHDDSEGMQQEFLAAGEVVPHRPDRELRLVGDFAERCPFKSVRCDDPEDRFDHFLAPQCGVDKFGH